MASNALAYRNKVLERTSLLQQIAKKFCYVSRRGEWMKTWCGHDTHLIRLQVRGFGRRHDIQYNDTQHDDTQQEDTLS
jgi:hypothetical protein